jgi:galactokinase
MPLAAGPARTWRAPGRVNVIGDHTDHQGGLCLPMAIDRECRVTVALSGGTTIGVRSTQLAGDVHVGVDGATDPRSVEPRWGRYVAGVVAEIVAACREQGTRLPPCEIVVSSSVPVGSGLASSSALTVALLVAFADLVGLRLGRAALARLALDAEVRATGVPGGIMDQMAALHARPGHVLLLDCRTATAEPIALPRSLGFVVVHSGQDRVLSESPYAERRADVDAVAARLGSSLRDATPVQVANDPRARHVVTENERVRAFAAALRAGRTGELGPLMLESHASLRDDYEASTPGLDRAVDLLMANGALGARLTGAGFGGYVVGLVQRNRADDVLAKVARALISRGEPEPDAFAVRPGAAAGELTESGGRPGG